MSNPLKIDYFHAISILAGMKDEYVWNVRTGYDNVLRMDFGTPHLIIHKTSMSQLKLTDKADVHLRRRTVVPAGRWHLFVEDGLWEIKVGDLICKRDEANKDCVEKCLNQLSGQKLDLIEWTEESREWHFSFDLGGVVSIKNAAGQATDIPDISRDSEWVIFFDVGFHLACVCDQNLILEVASEKQTRIEGD